MEVLYCQYNTSMVWQSYLAFLTESISNLCYCSNISNFASLLAQATKHVHHSSYPIKDKLKLFICKFLLTVNTSRNNVTDLIILELASKLSSNQTFNQHTRWYCCKEVWTLSFVFISFGSNFETLFNSKAIWTCKSLKHKL